ncbi:uncharacterized protein [Spinacia oleracea]|uniref:RNase H type-1 domain-containing protein n=1 Tax=Spinacia oleracea TaxID=3562 RepID=A0ABM3RJQ1_SPIOL|nr:uncharacterized protein LOC130470204 [Spinacia oleracea]
MRSTSPKVWLAPPEGIIKINCDASLSTEEWVPRDWKGDVIFSASIRVRAYCPPVVAECMAAAMAVHLASNHGLSNVIIETDCLVLVNRLCKALIFFTDLDAILEDTISWCHVKRDGNTVAHNLARLVPFGVEQIWENHSPCERLLRMF